MIDGELVAIDNDGGPDLNLLQNYRSSEAHLVYFAFDILNDNGKPDFNILQNFRSSEAHLVYFVVDILVHRGKSLLGLLRDRREILRVAVAPSAICLRAVGLKSALITRAQ